VGACLALGSIANDSAKAAGGDGHDTSRNVTHETSSSRMRQNDATPDGGVAERKEETQHRDGRKTCRMRDEGVGCLYSRH
jgi:hypothetical protein